MMVMEDTSSSNVAATQLSRQQIMQATADCLRQEGYDATTIRRIAAKLDCAVGSIYRYFKDKRDLLDAVSQGTIEPAAAVIDAGGSVEESAVRYHGLACRDPALYRLMFWISAVGEEAGNGDQPTTSRTTAPTAVPQIIDRIITGWGHRLGDPALARQCWMAVHGCIMLGLGADPTLAQLRSVTESITPIAAKEALALPHRTLRTAPPSLTPIIVTVAPPLPTTSAFASLDNKQDIEKKTSATKIAELAIEEEQAVPEDVVLL